MSAGGHGMSTQETAPAPGGRIAITAVAWLWVLIPFAYGLYQLVIKIPALFGG
jgi:hypothetical protein